MRPKIIIIEGTDGTGKSTLAAEMVELHDAHYVHAGPPTRERWTDEYISTVRSLLDNQWIRNREPFGGYEIVPDEDKVVVLDRWHLGEWVWPRIFGRKSLFSGFQDFMACHGSLVELGAVTFILTRDPGEIGDELYERGESQQQVQWALDGFQDFAELGQMGLPNVVMCDLRTARTMLGLEVASGDSIRSIH